MKRITKVINTFIYQKEDEEGQFSVLAFECPNCSEINDIDDDFVWENGRYEYRNPVDCESCDESDLLIIRNSYESGPL